MFHYGADAADVDAAVMTVCAMYGIHDVEVDITYQSSVINYVSEFDEVAERGQLSEAGGLGVEKLGLTLVRVVRSTSENYLALHQLYRLVHDIAQGSVSRGRAERRLAQVNAQKKPYSPAVLLAWNLLMAGAYPGRGRLLAGRCDFSGGVYRGELCAGVGGAVEATQLLHDGPGRCNDDDMTGRLRSRSSRNLA
ncbi:hypothetical protein E4U03_09330 [Rothia nasimurium]|uniref:Threonine/serine exporter-like N-terminal domain-containing protein n=2 Tax=Rothia nasimurium TaxID=85336 RepID=A0A4Y9F3B5_9MICC|nr:threonine/serine exporter family protein [Rothia nasimurium]MBF0808799.1 threonine/serine exporter family protein [Rothia nasimurium]TFU21304.1 hypothetical protein E4U03_09330 [Rothia nasimurium]